LTGTKRDHIYDHLEQLEREGLVKRALDKWCFTDELIARILAFRKGWKAACSYLGAGQANEEDAINYLTENPGLFIEEKEGKFLIKNKDIQVPTLNSRSCP
jgi:hypothetical protein